MAILFLEKRFGLYFTKKTNVGSCIVVEVQMWTQDDGLSFKAMVYLVHLCCFCCSFCLVQEIISIFITNRKFKKDV